MSENKQMYLLRVALLAKEGVALPIPLAPLAQSLDIQPVSANQMVHKLADVGLLRHSSPTRESRQGRRRATLLDMAGHTLRLAPELAAAIRVLPLSADLAPRQAVRSTR